MTARPLSRRPARESGTTVVAAGFGAAGGKIRPAVAMLEPPAAVRYKRRSNLFF